MIASMSLSELERRCNGVLHGKDTLFTSVSTDSRSIEDGDIYLALRGEHFDGHDFVHDAEDSALALVVEQACQTALPHLVVKNTRYALGQIGAYCREQFSRPVVAITGSSGKTTARNMLVAIMRKQGKVCTTVANQNNEIGVPLTLMTLRKDHTCAVLELGARHLGDIAYLGAFAKPDVSILLNAGSAHIGEFGGYQNIVLGKGEIYQVLAEGGLAIVNLDDPAASQWMDMIHDAECERVLTYSLSDEKADVYSTSFELSSEQSTFILHTPAGKANVKLPAPGEHNISNALAACCAAYSLDVPIDLMVNGLADFEAQDGRLKRVQLNERLCVIDDSYNANPASMSAALEVLAIEGGYRIAVLGEMGELGESATEHHQEIAERAAQLEIDEVWLTGTHAQTMKQVIGQKARAFASKQEIADALMDLQIESATVLLKASRFVALEDVIELYKRGSA